MKVAVNPGRAEVRNPGNCRKANDRKKYTNGETPNE
jgi:hypothetical protein